MQKGPPKILSIAEIQSTQYPAETNLPQWMIDGIGRVTVAQAFLEWRVTVLVFDLLMIDHPEGRVTLKDQSAFDRFKTVKSLLNLRGITSAVDVNALGKVIEECTTRRNQLVHGIWSRVDGDIKLRLTKDSFDTAEGQVNRTFMPQMATIPRSYFEDTVIAIEAATAEVMKLWKEVEAALLPRLQKRGLRETSDSSSQG
jgi:hypothetical protein